MIRLVNVSGGAGSAIALYRTVEKYGVEGTDAVFADTRSETDDTYKFLDAIEVALGIKIKYLSDGRDIWDVFLQHRILRIMRMGGACKASVELKQKPLAKYTKENYTPEECRIVTGLGWMEPERQERLQKRLDPYICEFPLNDEPRQSHCESIEFIRSLGLEPPEVYALGWPHNNCGKYGCIMAGNKQWAGLLTDYPEAFARSEEREQAFREKVGVDFAVLRDRRGGTSKAYPLKVLREDVEGGRHFGENWRSMCNCMGLAEEEQGTIFDLLEGCDP